MKKDHKSIIAEYLSNLSEEHLLFLLVRLTERKIGDLPEALNLMSENEGMDIVFSSAKSAEALFDLCDKVQNAVLKECKSRGVNTGRTVAA
jgi:uroporphyrinogen-III synthase